MHLVAELLESCSSVLQGRSWAPPPTANAPVMGRAIPPDAGQAMAPSALGCGSGSPRVPVHARFSGVPVTTVGRDNGDEQYGVPGACPHGSALSPVPQTHVLCEAA